jgi:two-component system response regulator AtoC
MSHERSLRILLADDEEIVHQTLGDYLRDSGHTVAEARDGLAGYHALEAHDYDLALVDVRMPVMDGLAVLAKAEQLRPDMPVVIIAAHADMELAIRALRLGAADFLTKPVKLVELDGVLEKAVRLRGLRRDKRRLHGVIRGLQAPAEVSGAGNGLVGTSPATCRVRQQIREAVSAGCETILITGETGTGKEVTAREIHFSAHPPDIPFIAVSCPALPEMLVESELFGHVKGSFTGATQDRMGYFELADGSTIFLDEIGDLSPAAQAKILRVLETRTLRRVGGSEEITVNVRVIAATNAPLEERVQSGSFRRDLFYRLNVYAIHLQPLRERREDILPLAEHLLAAYAAPRGLPIEGFSAGARDRLLSYSFPGNVRELRYVVERAAILGRAGPILAEHLTLPGATPSAVPPNAPEDEDPERAHLLRSLADARWNLREAAKRLGVPYSTLRYKMQKLGIKK